MKILEVGKMRILGLKNRDFGALKATIFNGKIVDFWGEKIAIWRWKNEEKKVILGIKNEDFESLKMKIFGAENGRILG